MKECVGVELVQQLVTSFHVFFVVEQRDDNACGGGMMPAAVISQMAVGLEARAYRVMKM